MGGMIDVLLGTGGTTSINRDRVYGVVLGTVTDNADPDKLYRVKVSLKDDMAGDDQSTFWAPICTFGAGKDRGMFNLPEVNDEVLVAFLRGDIHHPIVIGSVWNTDNSVFYDHDDGKNHKRTYKSRSGHILEFNDNDKDKKESITLLTKAGHKFILDDTDGALKCELTDKDTVNQMLFDTTNKELHIKTEGKMFIESKDDMSIKTDAKLMVESKADTTMKAENWTTTAKTNFTLEASGGEGKVTSSSTMTIKGSQVNIN